MRRSEHGFTLVELLTGISVWSVLTLGSLTIYLTLFVHTERALERVAAGAAAERVSEYLDERLANASLPLGLRNGAGIDPLSLAGDQILFRSGPHCYRVFWLARTEELRAALAPSCDDPQITPVRGPNEQDSAGNWVAEADPGAPDYDPVLDNPDRSFLLAGGITTAGASPLFTFIDPNGVILATDPRADAQPSATHSEFYSDQANRDQVVSIELQALSSDESKARPRARQKLDQQITLGQIRGSPLPAQGGRSDGRGAAQTWVSLAPGDDEQIKAAAGGPLLESTKLPTRSGWLEWSALVTLKSQAAGASALLRAELYRDGAPADPGTGEGQTVLRFPVKLPSGASRTRLISGSFRLPVIPGESTATSYSVRLSLANTGTKNVSYSTDEERLALSWTLPPA